jgi:tetratricopeptide (TPR) repeat protein
MWYGQKLTSSDAGAFYSLKQWFFLLICFLLVLLPACRKRGAALLEQAQIAWDAGDYVTAAARYEDFLRDNPRDEQAAIARFKAANIYFYNLHEYELAIQQYIHLIEDFPSFPEILQARERLAQSYAGAKKMREAIMEYENLLQLAPDFADKRHIRLNIADYYYELNELGQALAEYQKVLVGNVYDDLSERAQMRIGGIHLLRDEFDEAVPAFQTVASSTKDSEICRLAQFGLADCYERTFHYSEAIKVLERIAPDPKTPDYIPHRISAIRELERQRNLTISPEVLRLRK